MFGNHQDNERQYAINEDFSGGCGAAKKKKELEMKTAALEEEPEDMKLIRIAEERMKNYNPSEIITQEEIYREFNVDIDEIERLSAVV
jgi:hypothetical protein